MCDVTVDTSELVAQVINWDVYSPPARLNKLSLIDLIFCVCYDFDGFIQLSKVLFLPEKCERFEWNIFWCMKVIFFIWMFIFSSII